MSYRAPLFHQLSPAEQLPVLLELPPPERLAWMRMLPLDDASMVRARGGWLALLDHPRVPPEGQRASSQSPSFADTGHAVAFDDFRIVRFNLNGGERIRHSPGTFRKLGVAPQDHTSLGSMAVLSLRFSKYGHRPFGTIDPPFWNSWQPIRIDLTVTRSGERA